jgi:hypothetical protein
MRTSTPREPAEVAFTGCCPRFDPAPWRDRELVWDDKPFVKEHVHAFFHVPLDMGKKVVRAKARIDAAGADPAQPLMLSDETSRWGTDLYIEVTRPVPAADMATLSGTFLTQVFDGPFRDAPRWVEAMKRHVASRGRDLQKIYFGYTTCPSCAKAYGHNYVVLFAQVFPVVH